MKKMAIVDHIVNHTIDYLLKIEPDDKLRAKLYRKAGLELVVLGAQVDAESRFGD